MSIWRSRQVALFLVGLLSALADGVEDCSDSDTKCPEWAGQGECSSNAVWMTANCRKSCHSCQGGDRAWKLRTHLAATYDNSSSANETHVVRIESVRLSNVDIDERKQTVRVFGRMVMSWNDTKIAWDKDQWGLSWLNFYFVQIWAPQIVQVHSVANTATPPGAVTGKVLAANYTGQVYLWTDFSFSAPYHFQYENFPNDLQRVCYKFDDKRFLSVRFTVADEVKSKQREEVTETHVSGWDIEGFGVHESKYVMSVVGNWRRDPLDLESTNGELCVQLRRRAVFYFSEMLLPALITSAFTLASVFFQLSTTQSLMLGFSVLAQLLAMILLSSRLPAFTSETPTILKYAGFNFCSTGLLFILSLALQRLAASRWEIPPPHAVDQFIAVVDRFLPLPPGGKHLDEAAQKYAPLAYSLNNLLFLISFVVYLLVIFVSFVF